MKKWIAALAGWLMLASGVAAAQTVPSNECFSPGFVQVAQAVSEGKAVRLEAEFGVEDAFYARDLSVLGSMLSGTVIRYEGGSDASGMTDALTIEREGETLLSAALTQSGTGALLSVDGQVYDVSESPLLNWTEATPEEAQAVLLNLDGVPILERVPLTTVDAWLSSLDAGDALPFGLSVQTPFTIERTHSDDGTRLTRLDIDGVLLTEDGSAWTVSGFLRQPAGRAPKDTFELTFTCDDDNFIELSYSALRENEMTRKDKEGETTVTTALKAAGRLEGEKISSRLSVRMKNDWTADGETLNEKITITSTLTHQDNRPGKRMQRLNAVDAEDKHVIRIVTTQEAQETLTFTDEQTLRVTMDDNDFLAGSMSLQAAIGGQAPQPVQGEAQTVSGQELENVFESAVQTLSARIYAQLGETAREKISGDLSQ